MFCNRRQTVHDGLNDTWHQQHNGGCFDGQLQYAFSVIACQQADNNTHNKADGYRFTKRTKAFLDIIRAKVNAVESGDFLNDSVDQHGNRAEIS